ncbi:MAG TPA: aminotransferase class I/II-fold pyridoxal phosphate-dependent enzyme [Bacteroidales bacterium]|jgi:methionine-gamma-lyase|nr:aminotransferase class I/II-fold pyridoxal phosphate-dependent enzyme [Bacteroidales bacterium]MDI9573184.1 aminotransferase class I/II-fold pyridoxal phosphate-dependent enzyme [Bacteroidota bacterium]OQC59404.1 MAG: Methionine gamma-lyase [Bacteroidetes bacterium ADurb.Bin012]MBP9511859.1 aminotransferase class I/II-fold pyridoxal phosphate-dependent enzyme [Bacteroidales bacterium]MBP9588306.1 aminotransferase class I/II-fold pyridoxal phosphate-dependent enzyme [Bacteroidales bacterium]
MDNKELGFNSLLVHAGGVENGMNSAITPIYQTSTFTFENADHGAACFAGEESGYIYTRLGNPTITDLEKTLAILEKGYGGIATASGMGAVSTIYAGLLGAGEHMVGHEAVYGSSRLIAETIFKRFGVESDWIDTSDLESVEKHIRPNTKLIYLETPANPTMTIVDIAAISQMAHARNIKVCVDNTFCSPYLQNPLELGADVVLHSLTKFINGHADAVGGMIITKTEADYKALRIVMTNMGPNMDPHQAWLIRRGLKTLALRMERSQANAMKVAEFLENHPKVAWVKYPGLKSHPQYELACKQMRGPGAMISFEVKGGLPAGKIVMDNVKLALLAVSLGGIETLIQHPASMTHSKMSPEARHQAGISDGLIRLSVGIEEAEDIVADLSQALDLI